jgi:rubrerythrin
MRSRASLRSVMKVSQAIRNAVQAEREAAKFYQGLADGTSQPEVKSFLEDMAKVEIEHARAIEEMGQRLIGGDLADRADADLSMVETLPDWTLAVNITLAQAADIALAAEHQASLYYDALSDCFHGAARTFFLDLAKAEDDHADMLVLRKAAAQGR